MSRIRRAFDWISPPLPPGDAEIDRAVKEALALDAIHLNKVVAPLVGPTALIWTMLLWTKSPRLPLVSWLVVVCAMSVAMTILTCRHDGNPATAVGVIKRLAPVLAASGTAFGALSVMAMPTDPAWRSLVGMMILAAMSTNVIFAASIPRMFWSFQLPVAMTGALGFVLFGGPLGWTVASILVYAVPFSQILARIKRSTDERAAYFAATSHRRADQLRTLNDELAHQATHDHLTGLPNRQEFARRLELAVAETDGPGPVVLFLDLDHFKHINDALGHSAGDEALRLVAARLRAELRPGDLVARIGGDEFTALIDGPGCHESGKRLAERILAAFETPVRLGERWHRLGVSIGMALGEPDMTGAELLRQADGALYQAKAAGRGNVQLRVDGDDDGGATVTRFGHERLGRTENDPSAATAGEQSSSNADRSSC